VRRLAAAVGIALVVSAAVVASASGATPARLRGTFAMQGKITVADDVRGEHVGQRVQRSWTFYPQCRHGACKQVVLKRRRSARGILDTVTLNRKSPGVYRGRGRFWMALKCKGKVVHHAGVAAERITVRVTRTALEGDTRIATGISASYFNPYRHQYTRCPGVIGHDSATYAGQLAVGAGQLAVGAGQLAVGAGQLAVGAGQLKTGATAASGTAGHLIVASGGGVTEFHAPAPTTGNPQGVKLAHKVMRAFARIPAYRQSEQHFFQLKYGANHQFHYRFGEGHRPGFVWTTEKATVRIHRNHVLWWQDTLKPVSGNRSPVMFVLNKNGRYTAYGTPAHHSCFTKLPRTSMLPYRYGGLGYSIGGRMRKPQRGPTTVLLPYVYRWAQHLTANESDTISRATKLVLSGKVNITRHDGASVLAFDFANTYPSSAPRAPTVKLCRR
jgi:X-X-X-Leu-X-X-Gly heptad repeat protein